MPFLPILPSNAQPIARAIADERFDDEAIRPLPTGARALLLGFLALVYSPGDAQARLGNAPDAAIAWQVQSALDDFADYAARAAYSVSV